MIQSLLSFYIASHCVSIRFNYINSLDLPLLGSIMTGYSPPLGWYMTQEMYIRSTIYTFTRLTSTGQHDDRVHPSPGLVYDPGHGHL